MANENKSLSVKVRSSGGADAGAVAVDEATLGGMVKTRLLHSATVMYHANMRAGTHCTKTRAEISGSTKKLYRQKGTGRARAGSRLSGTRKHGGIIHGPKPRKYGFDMPKKQRRAAVKAAVLAKVKDGEAQIIESFGINEVKTKVMTQVLKKLGLIAKDKKTSLLIITNGLERSVHLSARNIEGVEVLPVEEANARDVLTHRDVLFTKAAFERFQALATRAYVPRVRKLKGTRKAGAAPAAAPAGKAQG